MYTVQLHAINHIVRNYDNGQWPSDIFSPFKVYLLHYVTSLLWNIEVIYEWLFYVTVLGLKCILLNKGV